MSAQAGVFYTDRRPIPLQVVERIDAALADFGPDGGGSRLEPGLLMLSRALHITPEDEREEQPLVSPAGRVLTWDGRLDNRDDLLLQFHRDLGIDATDGALALAAFERWGVDGFARLIGDWSLALWDAPERRLVLASDYMGVRPLYYRRAADHVAWSSSLGELVLREGVKDDLDDVFVVGFLVGFVAADRTPYLPVRSVTPACALSFSAAGVTCHRFYDYPANTIRYRHVWEYEEHLRDVFAQAVGARLRSTRPAWAELSGGLDSSSIVCMADWLLQRGQVVASSVETISAVSDSSQESDERRFILEVEKQRQCPGHHLVVEECLGHTDPDRAWIAPQHPTDFRLRSIQFVSERGGRLLLTGNAGDTVMANSMNGTGHVIEAWRHVGPWAAFLEAHEWSLATKRTMLSTIGRASPTLLPLKWRVSSVLHQCLRDRLESPLAREIASLVVREVWRMAYAEFVQTLKSTIPRSVCETTPEKDCLRREVYDYAAYGVLKEPSDVPRIALTHPYGDRRLIELVLAMPCSALTRPGEPRWLMRRGLGSLLPERVRHRFSKGYAAPFLTRAVRQAVLDLRAEHKELELVRRGHLRREALEIRLDTVQHSPRVSDEGLVRLILLERWLRALARPSSRADLNVPAGTAELPHERR